MQYSIKLADGKVLTGFTKNGDNFVSKEQVDESIFEDNLAVMTVSDGETETTYHNVELIQQVEYADGWYLAFRELTAQELRDIEINAKIEYIAMMADVDIEEV